jgi:hypothetical protein
MMLPAHGAKLFHLELFGHRPLVLGGRVIGAAAFAAGHFDDVAHVRAAELSRAGGRVKMKAGVLDVPNR